ncbi:uncharacterized protein LOC130768858 [Actinidia eriantha]|uniref:uncharacterized protein LOC130768858 n=1 Tax=Actinidia eriantha TaxID=165200 RepID=UPI002584DC2B|nr:uncharacterized protein LOC130768858 [Actinidia eriantha]
MDQVTYFSSKYKVTNHLSQFPSLLLFMSKYKVPWIFKWQYNIANNIVIRQHFVKWWDAFKHYRIIDQVKLEFPVLVPTPIPTPVKQIPTASSQPTPDPQQGYSTVNLGSPSSSHRTSKSKKSKSKKIEFIQDNTELLRVANLLLAQVQAQAQSAVKEESESDSSNCSTAQSEPNNNNPYASVTTACIHAEKLLRNTDSRYSQSLFTVHCSLFTVHCTLLTVHTNSYYLLFHRQLLFVCQNFHRK